jgi:ABC-type transport system involved in multi-copper enzyme maturation permease subunit
MRKRWANWILIAVLLALMVLLGYVISYLILTNPPKGFRSEVPASVLKREVFPENLVPNVLSGMGTIGAAIMIILGGLNTASEYSWGTVQTILIQRPSRLAVLFGKLLALTAASLLVSVVVLALAALTSFILATVDGSAITWPAADVLVRGFGALWLQLQVWTMLGMFLGLAFRSTAAAIGGGMTYLFVIEAIVGGLLRNTAGLKELLRFLPGINASGINATFPFTFPNPNAVTNPLVSATRGTVTLVVYLVVFVVLAALIFRRRDVGA